jgi:hypothetical protein
MQVMLFVFIASQKSPAAATATWLHSSVKHSKEPATTTSINNSDT